MSLPSAPVTEVRKKPVSTKRLFREVSDLIRSGDHLRAEQAVRRIVAADDPAVWLQLLNGTFIDRFGVLWVPEEFIVKGERQPVVDHTFLQLISLAPKQVCQDTGIRREQITRIRFRSYCQDLMPSHFTRDPRWSSWEVKLTRFPEEILKLPGLLWIDARDSGIRKPPDGFKGFFKQHTILRRDEQGRPFERFGTSVEHTLSADEWLCGLSIVSKPEMRDVEPKPVPGLWIRTHRDKSESFELAPATVVAKYIPAGHPHAETSHQVQLITSMLSSPDLSTFLSGMNLLEAASDPDLTAYCLDALPVLPSGSVQCNGPEHQQSARSKALFEFLLGNPEMVNAMPGNWRHSVRRALLPLATDRFDIIGTVFPNLATYRFELGGMIGQLRPDGIGSQAEFLALQNFNGDGLTLEGTGFVCRELVIHSSVISGKIKISGLPFLEVLKVYESAVAHLEIDNCPSLKSIKVSGQPKGMNRVTGIRVTKCTSLTELHLHQIKLSGFLLSDCPELQVLSVKGACSRVNRFAVSGTPRLNCVSLIGCRLTALPPFLGSLSGLEVLDLSKNRISEMGEELGNLTGLYHLNLSGNRLTILPHSLSKLQNLQRLIIGWQGKRRRTLNFMQDPGPALGKVTSSILQIALFLPERKLRQLASRFPKQAHAFCSQPVENKSFFLQ